MIKGPLVYSVVVLAAALIVLSFGAAFAPDEYLMPISAVAGVVALLAIVVLVIMFFRIKRLT